MSSRYQLIESPKGRGKIFRDDQFLAESGYSLAVRQERVRAGNEWLEGHLQIDGKLTDRSTWEDLEELANDPFFAPFRWPQIEFPLHKFCNRTDQRHGRFLSRAEQGLSKNWCRHGSCC